MKILLLVALMLPIPAWAAPGTHAECKLDNLPVTIQQYHKDQEKLEEKEFDDWHVVCSVTVGNKEIYRAPLALAHPTEFRDAADAAREFVKVKSKEIIAEWRKEHK